MTSIFSGRRSGTIVSEHGQRIQVRNDQLHLQLCNTQSESSESFHIAQTFDNNLSLTDFQRLSVPSFFHHKSSEKSGM
jgi:hypothetical protein